MSETNYQKAWRLIDHKDEIIARWVRELGKEGSPVAHLNLTAPQRRVIANLRWERELAKLNDPLGGPEREQQPPPIAGLDGRKRVVIQFHEKGVVRMWALTRDGGPADIKLPVHSLKDGRRIEIPPHIYTVDAA